MRDLFNRRKFIKTTALSGAAIGVMGPLQFAFGNKHIHEPIVVYTRSKTDALTTYDESMVVACLQGIINRKSPLVYIAPSASKGPGYWLDILSTKDGWLNGRPVQQITDLDALFALAKGKVKGAVIWDPTVPASINVATTIAGVEDGIVLSPELAEKYLSQWELPIIKDLRGMFTGKATGSAKNDAYRWAVREYLSKGLCSGHWLCLYEDAFFTRERGDVSYVVTRDWAITNRSFVYDLSPWGDEKPKDDPEQPMGTDLATYHIMLSELLKQTSGKEMTEVAGFFSFSKYSNVPNYPSKHDPVPTEWETVYLISPYNCYQNTVAHNCFNQSFHSKAPSLPLKQHRPKLVQERQNKTYLCILMADYDSTTPLYEFLPEHWSDERRGEIPLIWGINPNLVETYPDLIHYFYTSASENDFFGADASAAGYMNPNRIKEEHLPLFIQHNKKFYQHLDMTLSPMVLDWDEPTDLVKDAFTKFSPDGLATIVLDFHNQGGKNPEPHVWKGMPVMELINSACNFSSLEQTAKEMSDAIPEKPEDVPAFHFFRIVWTSPGQVIDSIDLLRKNRPDIDIEVADPYNFFRMFKAYHE
jgi:hypothetical protein